ncbi:hypothetical protein A2533_00460 [Candidatus Falkowbacteria bacterium RIFOXYD2_FULL_35_9]|uniref:Anti-sigma factor n=2 Tax=Candidatus Falkowiibacteriota TaxID=1752728 RepID=A0A1F5T0P3_9BACT|nr:MAG: hypothetical protein A2242_00940 [Candidatus Falkowbacteria bacterium RIFOXYA2_FULL_47_9]OGF30839.1 MAG: hypothetical protein A2300_03140 [Candidatus Falkowbacteria bacterium RIFOXYB2_FULL_35_7]OGF32306.1 MAG: hypothetical protein A2478_03205 [Candidatus Falkowbacteria bacterium RIFOXYC2_FULL_36_12]OGF46643.1 MAG: hypothetical protein A2533_00460 [Candidatus Falkowbacteria bacterium RIFOXYD2_FULL_35_9]
MKKLVILIVAVLIVGFGWWYVSTNYSSPDENEPKAEIFNQERLADYEGQKSIQLTDVSGGGAVGTAWLVFKDGQTYNRVMASDLLGLENNDFYEGWLVNPKTKQYFSTGKLNNLGDGNYYLEFNNNSIKEEYNFVVITLESDDGDSFPAKHILEGGF